MKEEGRKAKTKQNKQKKQEEWGIAQQTGRSHQGQKAPQQKQKKTKEEQKQRRRTENASGRRKMSKRIGTQHDSSYVILF